MARGDNPELEVALNEVLEETGATGDELIRALLKRDDIWGPIIRTQIRNAMSGSTQAAKWLADRAMGTPTQTVKHEGSIDLAAVFGNPLDATDELYDLEAEETRELESGD